MGHDDDLFDAETPSEAAAGAIAGLAEHLVMFPFDTIRTRMQEVPERHPTMLATMRTLAKEEPLRHLYRGCVPVACSAIPAHAVYFSLYEKTKRWLVSDNSLTHAFAAALATTAHDTVSVPFDVVKQRMQTDGQAKFRSSIGCARQIFKTEGPSAFFKSLPTTVAMNIPHVTVQWVVYERMKKLTGADGEERLTMGFVVSGFAAGATAAVASQPLDVVKTQVQLGKSPSMSHALRSLYKAVGLGGFYTGLLPRICYIGPSSAVVMTTYEVMKSLLGL
jgi:solute carrier family 25 iron transporter 28/37